MLNGAQNKIFRPLVQAAWLTYCDRNAGADPEDKVAKDAWYRKAIIEGLGIWSTKEIPEHDEARFDALCLHFATLAGADDQIAYWSRAAERRALWRLEQTMKNAGVDWIYVRAVARRMNLGDKPIQDLPAELILKLNTAIFLHWKRNFRAIKEDPCLH